MCLRGSFLGDLTNILPATFSKTGVPATVFTSFAGSLEEE